MPEVSNVKLMIDKYPRFKYLFALIYVFGIAFGAFGQSYTIDYSGISVFDGNTPIEVILGDDELSSALPIGFSFNFFGTTYTDFYISSNGFITFDASAGDGCCEGQYLPEPSDPNNLIALAWGDLNLSAGGYYSYETMGTPGSRRLIVSFFDFDYDCYYGVLDGQIWLYEGTNVIEMHMSEFETCFYLTTQGIENADGTEAFFDGDRNSDYWSAYSDYIAFIPAVAVENDAGVSYSPSLYCAGDQPIRTIIKNFGSNDIDSLTVNWEWGGVPQTSIDYASVLPSGLTVLLTLDTLALTFGQTYDLKVWTSDPNGMTDAEPSNDTVSTVVRVGLQGTYTIGGTSPDYVDFASAIADLDSTGICDSVIFDVRDGMYNEQIEIPYISGAFGTNRVVFQSESGDSSAVTLHYNSTQSSDNYTLRLNNAYNITFQDMTIEAEGGLYGRAIELVSLCGNDEFTNCSIRGVTSTGSSTYQAVIWQEGVAAHSNTHFDSCTVSNGTYGFYHSNGFGQPVPDGLTIENCLFDNQSYIGIYLDEYDDIIINANTIQSDLAGVRGIDMLNCETDPQITRNAIFLAQGLDGIRINENGVGNSTAPHPIVANNMISVGGNSLARGINLISTNSYGLYFNSIWMYGSQPYSKALEISGGAQSNNVIKNNVLVHTGAGYAIERPTSASGTYADRNVYYTVSDTLGEINNAYYADLPAWQVVSGWDSTSLYFDPLFVDTTDLHTINPLLNKAGIVIADVSDDFDGEIRDPALPDIGADEFLTALNDIAVVGFTSPSTLCQANQDVIAIVKNFGRNLVTGFDVDWSLDGIGQTGVSSGASIDTTGGAGSDTVHVNLGVGAFTANQIAQLKAWSLNPNSVADGNTANDTTTFDYQQPLSGIYTVGGVSPDYISLNDAVDALKLYGICGPTTLALRDGTYSEQVVIPKISGTSVTDTIVITSESSDSASVKILFDPSVANNYLIKLDGADYITISHLSFEAPSFFDDRLITLVNGANHIILEHCDFKGATSDGTDAAIVYSNSPIRYLIIRNCTFFKGSEGVFLSGSGTDSASRIANVEIYDNAFSEQLSEGIQVINAAAISVYGNTVDKHNINHSYRGVSITDVERGMELHDNKVDVSASGGGFYLSAINSVDRTVEATVYNNFIRVSQYSWTGMSVVNSYNMGLFHNNINNLSSDGSADALEVVGGDSLDIKNNICVSNGGPAFYFNGAIAGNIADHNNLYSFNGSVGYFSGVRDTLGAWQVATGWDANSISEDPNYYSNGDLHVLNAAIDSAGTPVGIANDIDGETRNMTAPDIGADELGTTINNLEALALFPRMPFPNGNQPVQLVVRNLGGNFVDTFNIDWTINGVAQAQFNYSDTLGSLDIDTITIGTPFLDFNTAYSIRAWTSLPNGVADSGPANDTVQVDQLYASVGDTLTIGGVSPDFDSIGHALEAILEGGVLDTTVFLLRNGTYTEAITFPASSAFDCNFPMTFESETGVASDVVWDDNDPLLAIPLTLAGADGLIFKNITLRSLTDNAVLINGGSDCNTFIGCHFVGQEGNLTSASDATVYSNTNFDTANVFISNIFEDGSFGIYLSGNSGGREPGTKLLENLFKDQYYRGINVGYQIAPEIIGNTVVNSESGHNSYSGISCGYVSGALRIIGNQVLLPGRRGNGIAVGVCSGNSSTPGLIANNFVLIGDSTSSHTSGIVVSNSSYQDVFYNSVQIIGLNTLSRSMHPLNGSNIRLKNNVFDNVAGGFAIYMNSESALSYSNYNDLVSTGNLVRSTTTEYSDLAAWQATGRDTNSISIDPQFADTLDLHAQSAMLDGAASPDGTVILDFDGELRDILFPDIGADEFNLFSDDVAILAINYPTQPFPSGINTVFIKFSNNGDDTLTTMQVDWEVDGIPQPEYLWTGLLGSGETYDSLDLGTFDFTAYETHTIKVWVSAPNGMTDGVASNDTITISELYPGLLGVYTIGGIDPDFNTIGEALIALDSGGVAGQVTFNIRDGVYLETMEISEFPGCGCATPVIFQSESQDSSKVTISNLGIDAHLLTLDGADGLVFQHLTLESVNPAFRHVVEYFGGADCNTFRNNHLKGYDATGISSNYAVVYSYTDTDIGNIFENNLITDGSYGLYLRGVNGQHSGTVIRNNEIPSSYSRGIYAYREDGLVVDRNFIHNTDYTSFYGVYVVECDSAIQVINNTVIAESGRYGIDVVNSVASANQRALIANNFSAVGGTSNCFAYYNSGNKYMDFVFNSGHNYTTKTSNASNQTFYGGSCTDLRLFNNVLVNSSVEGAVLRMTSSGLVAASNNCYHNNSLTNYIEANGIVESNLADWQMNSGLDSNSVDADPQFMSDVDLHASLVLLNVAGIPYPGITTDIDKEPRDAATPDIGADEFVPAASDDAGVFSFEGPEIPFASGSQAVVVTLKNFGGNALTSANIRWVINGIEQAQYNWTGSLLPGQCDTVSLGSYSYLPYTGHDHIIWSELPNGVPDSTHVNDTITVNNLYPGLIGDYTVGGVLPDFNVFSQLQDALNNGGIIGDVNFKIRDGLYATQISVQAFPRSSPGYIVTFEPELGNSGDVQIIRDFSSSSNYTVQFDQARNIRLTNLKISSTVGRVIEITNGANNISLDSCEIIGKLSASTASSYSCIYSGSTTEDSISIINNSILNGSYGIILSGSNGNPEKRTYIGNNIFRGQSHHPVQTYYQDSLMIDRNDMEVASGYSGVYIYRSTNTVIVSNNRIIAADGGTGIRLQDCHFSSGARGIVFNNYVQTGGTYKGWGIIVSQCSYLNLDYNTLRVDNAYIAGGAYNQSAALYFYGGSNHLYRNNILACYGGARCYYGSAGQGDYNDLYTTGPYIAYHSTDYASLVTLIAGSAQNLNSVAVDPLLSSPEFPTSYQLALDGAATPIAGILNDFDGEVRDLVNPDIGADEFTLLSNNIGISLLVSPATYCGLSAAENVTLRIQNFGSGAQTGFDVGYSINGSGWTVENIGGTSIPGGQFFDYTFSSPLDLSAVGTYTFAAYSALGSDSDTSNDSIWNIDVVHIPALVSPVTNMVPSDGTADLEKTVSLSWAPAPNATKYDVYIWEDGNAQPMTPQIIDLVQINKLYSQLNYGTTYNWQVIAKNVCDQMVAGPVQQFVVRSLPDLVVDTVIAPLVAYTGQTIQVEWQVRNLGDGETQSQLWTDAVYLSQDATLNTSYDTYLGGVQNLAALDSGIAYMHMDTFILPVDQVGNYYLIVAADRFSNLIESNNNNNWERSQVVTAISLSPSPDLIVTDVSGPSIAFSGEEINVLYTVKNQGNGETGEVTWRDRIYLSPDPLNPIGLTLGTYIHTSNLLPDSTYTSNVMIDVPEGISGVRYAYIETDALDEVFEFASEGNNEGSSDTVNVILSPPADLVMIDIDIPDTISSDDAQQMSWSVKNAGAGATLADYWLDEIFISPAPVFNDNFNTRIRYGYQTVQVASLDTYDLGGSATIPKLPEGLYYLYGETDARDDEYEFDMEGNNIYQHPGQVFVVNPDLFIANIQYPDTVLADTLFSVSWDQLNIGNGGYHSKTTRTSIYASADSILDTQNAHYLGYENGTGNEMASGDTMPINIMLSIPAYLYGEVYIHLVGNSNNRVYEGDNDTNNIQTISTPIWVHEGFIPDLTVVEMTHPDTLTAGVAFTFDYVTANQGFNVAEEPWDDELYISFDSIWNPVNAILLTGITQSTDLSYGDSLTSNNFLTLDNATTENVYYLYALIDVDDDIYESGGESNNISRSDAVYVLGLPNIDIALDTIVFDTSSLMSGMTREVSWTVSIQNGVSPIIPSWNDRVYLSLDQSLDTLLDVAAGNFVTDGQSAGFGPGQPVSTSGSLMIPNGISGNYYLIMEADADRFHLDTNRTNNIDLLRDSNGQPMLMTVQLAQPIDLIVENVIAPASAVSGQQLEIEITVKNNGVGNTQGTWRDRVYLSLDGFVNAGDILLSDEARSNLNGGMSYSDTLQVSIPLNFTGNYILIVQTDQADQIYEHNAEHNNEVQRSIELTLPPPSDLIVTSVVVPLVAIAGEPSTISWTTENAGTFPASGQFREIVYLSQDTSWDVNDALFGIVDQIGYLPPMSQQSSNFTGPVKDVVNGDYYAIVQTDARNNFSESDETNNYTSSVDIMDVDVKTLFMDSLTLDTLVNVQELYYKIVIPPSLEGESMILSLDGDSINGLNELYVKYADMPSRADFDYTFDIPFSGSQRLIISSLEVGTYFILGFGLSTTAASQEVELLARIVPFDILSISPMKGVADTKVTVEIKGIKLNDTEKFRLRQNDPWFELVAESVFEFSDNLVYATFDLLNVPVDTYSLDAIKADSSMAFVQEGFLVVADGAADLQITVQAPGAYPRRPVPVKIVINYKNHGDVDVENAFVRVEAPYGNLVAYTLQELRNGAGQSVLDVPIFEENGPPGIVRPGAGGTIEVFAWSEPGPSYAVGIKDE